MHRGAIAEETLGRLTGQHNPALQEFRILNIEQLVDPRPRL